jgi:DNA mismatch repair protein MutL
MRIIGVLGKLYVLLESDRGLVLLDQHAAHERILFEKMLKELEHGEAPSQRLLLAETIELNPRDTQFVHRVMSKFQNLGVELREFGDQTFILDALPPFVKTKNMRQFILDVIDTLKESGDVNKLRLGEDVIAKTVCRHAVKANDMLRGPELEKLLDDLKVCDMPYTCPHGRPTLMEMSFNELEKKFGRIQG